MQRLISAGVISMIAFAAVLAAVIASRLDPIALALIAGVVLGVAVSLPATAVALMLLWRAPTAKATSDSATWPVLVPGTSSPQAAVAAPTRASSPAVPPAADPYWLFGGVRAFYIVGEDGRVDQAE